ncbi:GNAT domain [Macleaya cordata]|uniref:GNAT domain n=1 Tax=Macleaya cordata TaxID=56857 RepID=A0A200Q0N4_MACCD|nr:GNAT domain [Macleaya cordata]
MTTIREFGFDDLLRTSHIDDLSEFTPTVPMAQYSKSSLMPYLVDSPDQCFLAEGPGNRIMGCVFGKVVERSKEETKSKHGVIVGIYVDGDYRRQKVASKLMQKMDEVYHDKRVDSMEVTVRESNVRALRMCQKFGYERVDRIPYLFTKDDAEAEAGIRMVKTMN